MRWLLLICAFASCRSERAKVGRRELARVNDERIYVDELERELRRTAIEGVPPSAPEANRSLAERRRMLDSMVDRKLLLQEAVKQKIVVPISHSDRLFNRLKDDFPTDQFGKMLEEKGVSPVELKQSFRDQLMVSKLLKEQVYDRVYIKDEELLEYFKAHPETAKLDERVHCAQIVQRTDADMNKVRQHLSEGMPFEEAATRFSIAPEANKGGDLGWFPRAQMPQVIEEGCFGLKVGEVSKPMNADAASEGGDTPLSVVHLFKLLGKRDDETLPYERVRDQLESKLRNERAQRDELAFLQALKQAATITIDEAALQAAR